LAQISNTPGSVEVAAAGINWSDGSISTKTIGRNAARFIAALYPHNCSITNIVKADYTESSIYLHHLRDLRDPSFKESSSPL
jgi:hypothetical protein